jgi:hypothetical protein
VALKLHEAMDAVLRDAPGDGWMDRDELARRIAERDLYHRRDGSTADGDQMRLRVGKYPHLFVGSDSRCSRIRLRRG